MAEALDIITGAFYAEELTCLQQRLESDPSPDALPLSVDGKATIGAALHLAVGKQWEFGGEGDPVSPAIQDPELGARRLTQADMAAFRQIAFPDVPTAMVEPGRVQAVRDSICKEDAKACDARPIALVTIGTPGSGKSRVVRSIDIEHLTRVQASSSPITYVNIDPDHFLTELCENDNSRRTYANFCNHESFIYALAQRRNLVFQGTGKDLETTCSRVISRLLERGYQIYMCIVLASEATCLERIARRKQETGRDVPHAVVRGGFAALRTTIPVYLSKRAQLGEAVLLFDNDTDDLPSAGGAPTCTLDINSSEADVTAALELVNCRLGLAHPSAPFVDFLDVSRPPRESTSRRSMTCEVL